MEKRPGQAQLMVKVVWLHWHATVAGSRIWVLPAVVVDIAMPWMVGGIGSRVRCFALVENLTRHQLPRPNR